MRIQNLFKAPLKVKRPYLAAPGSSILPERPDTSASLRAAWPSAPAPRWSLPQQFMAPAKPGTPYKPVPRSAASRPSIPSALDLSFAHSRARSNRIIRGLKQAGILAQPNQPLMQLPTYSLLQGRLSRTDALKGKHMLGQKEWAAVWVALNVHHHGLKAVPTRITRLPMDMRYDFFVVAGVTDRPETSRTWVHALRDAGVLSRRLHPKSYVAMADAALALGLPLQGDVMGRIQDSLFTLPGYRPTGV